MKKIVIILLLTFHNLLCSLEPVILLFGPPGSGKGTFADAAIAHGFNHISAGDLVRDEIRLQTDYGKEFEALVRRGEYVDQNTLFQLMKEKILHFKSEHKPFIIDAYGRTEKDLLALREFLVEQKLDEQTFVLFLQTDDTLCKERILTRLVCDSCHHVYNTKLDSVIDNGLCPHCKQGHIEVRLNDTIEVIEKRMKKYREEIECHYLKSAEFFPMLRFTTNRARRDCLAFYTSMLSDMQNFQGRPKEFVEAHSCSFVEISAEVWSVVESAFQGTIEPIYGPQAVELEKLRVGIDRTGFVMFDYDIPVGITVFKKAPSHEIADLDFDNSLEVKSFFVINPKLNSGKGYGSKLLQKTIEQAKQLHTDSLFITVSKKKPDSLNFFLKKGFALIKEIPEYYYTGDTEYILAQKL